jgi:hypothetical protein
MSLNIGGRHNVTKNLHRQVLLDARRLVSLVDSEGGPDVGGSITGTVQLKIPDPRLWVKVSFLFVPDVEGATPDGGPELWGVFREQVREPAPAHAQFLAVEDVIGTSAAPLSIPANAALFGHIEEFQTDADEFYARLSVGDDYTAGHTGSWWVWATATAATEMERHEWDHIAAAFKASFDVQAQSG